MAINPTPPQKFKLDPFQLQAIEAIKRNQSVLVSAPTGSGKTLIAEYAVKKCFDEETGVIYTAPVKALSNQKYREFQILFPGSVGIITGDVNINPQAPLIIMTTEIFHNKILEDENSFRNYSWIIFDEIHYLDDIERGTVWEESLIFLPSHIKILGLSATIPNIDEFSRWLREIHSHPISIIKEFHRPVPLHFLFQFQNRIITDISYLNNRLLSRKKSPQKRFHGIVSRPSQLIHHLLAEQRLPCIYFCFSRKRSEFLAEHSAEFNFLTDQESEGVLRFFDELTVKFQIENEFRTKQMRELLTRGIAYHHAGLQPMLKEVVEQLFTAKMIKIIFTTETFALGINMPAKTVVIDEMRKKYQSSFRTLRVRDFFQMAGRSGRRGIDKEGFVYSRINPYDISMDQLRAIFSEKLEPIRSHFNISYASILNLFEKHGELLIDVYSVSFHYFQERNKSNLMQLKLLKNKLQLLKDLGYIVNNQLSQKGHFAKNLYGYELTMGELFGIGLFEELTTSQLAILCLAAVFEPRAIRKERPRMRGEVKFIQKVTSQIIKKLQLKENRRHVFPYSKNFYFDMSESLYSWMEQTPFAHLMDKTTVDEGEIIRFYRMTIQILREMLDTPLSSATKDKLAEAIRLIKRGVIDAEEQLKIISQVEAETQESAPEETIF